MQSPETPSPISSSPIPPSPYDSSSMPPMPPKKSKVVPILLGCGCGVPLLGLILLFIIGSLSGPSTTNNTASNTATPATSPPNAKSTPDGAAASTSLDKYLGKWQGNDGTSIWIRGDGKGDYDGGNTKVSGGGMTLDSSANTLAITSFFGIGKTWKIDAPPHKKNGQTEMTLGGVVYRREGGFDASSSESSTSASTPSASKESFDATKIPTVEQQRRLARETMRQFDAGLANKNFTAFHKYCSQTWQEQTTPAQMRAAFQEFITKKIRVIGTLNKTPTFSPAPAFNDEGSLVLQGSYPTTPLKTYFRLTYIAENDQWKLLGIRVKTGGPIK